MNKRWVLFGLLWSACVALVALDQVRQWQHLPWDTDIMALLPDSTQAHGGHALQTMAEAAAQEVVVAVGAADWATARRGAEAFSQQLHDLHAPLRPSYPANRNDFDTLLAVYRPHRAALLTDDQRLALQTTPITQLVEQAMSELYEPTGVRLTPWVEDPLGLWAGWWQARAQESPAQPRDGLLSLERDGRSWAILMLSNTAPAFSLSQAGHLSDGLAQARCAAEAVGPVQVAMAGFPVHADAAAKRANWEINTIGWGSLAAVLLLVWATFRSLRPVVLVSLSLAVGCAAALAVTAWVFDRVHVLTAVFGSTLVGVAEDYGIHYFTSRQGHPASARWQVLRHHLPGLAMAMATSVLGYLMMGLAPFPGLRQMALFSAVGIAAAFATVACWFPWLDGGELPVTGLARHITANLARWPRLTWRHAGPVAMVGVVLAGGLWRLQVDDDLRSLQSSPAELVAQQRQVGDLLALPSPAQFYEVHGANPETVLQREEALRARLQPLREAGHIAGVQATSLWVPSRARQLADAALTRGVEAVALARVAEQIGETWAPLPQVEVLELAGWEAAVGATSPVRGLWLGEQEGEQVSIVQVRGLHGGDAALAELEAAARAVPGVRWINKTADISGLLRRYRGLMGGLLVLSMLAIGGLLLWRFGREAWRAWVPTVLATVLALASLGWVGLPLQLFAVLALLLVMGIGVDYGIFLLEDPGNGAAWVAVVVGAASTWLSFGLLGLSATPALRVFGLTTFFGVGWVWLLTPCFRRTAT